jgi:hypothetical protein
VFLCFAACECRSACENIEWLWWFS